MSALSIQVPFPIFNDRDGQPLDNGYVWIGVPNLPPQTNPVNVYFDEALTILAPQPLRTINGYVSNAGSPAQVYINGVNFSILVQDSKGSMVYNFPEGTGIDPNASGVAFTGFKGQVGFVADLADDDGSDWIGFEPAGSGAVARSAQDKLRETVSVKDFGAVGDGRDDSAAFSNALTHSVQTGAWLDLQGLTINLNGVHIEKTLTRSDFVRIKNGKLVTSGSRILTINGTSVATGTVSVPLNFGATKCTLSSVSGIQIDDLLYIQSNVPWHHDDRGEAFKGEFSQVVGITGSVVEIADACYDTYSASEILTFAAYSAPTVQMQDVVLETSSTSSVAFCLYLFGCKDVTLNNVYVINGRAAGFQIRRCYNVNVNGGGAEGCTATTAGYGVQFYSSTNCFLIGAKFRNNRRGADISGSVPSRNVLVQGCFAEGGGVDLTGAAYFNTAAYVAGTSYASNAAYSTHGPSEAITFSGNFSSNVESAYICRGRGIVVTGNTHYGPGVEFAYIPYGGDVSITNNSMLIGAGVIGNTDKTIDLDAAPTRFVRVIQTSNTELPLVIENNFIDALKNQFVFYSGTYTSKSFNVACNRNQITVVRNTPGSSAFSIFGLGSTFSGCSGIFQAVDNSIRRGTGFTGVITISSSASFWSGSTARVIEGAGQTNSRLLSDDTAIEIPVTQRRSGRVFVRINYGTLSANLLGYEGWLRSGETTVLSAGANDAVTISNVALTGTTGVDGAFTISYVDNVFYAENRTGGARYVTTFISTGQ